jgi:hypothetical protein
MPRITEVHLIQITPEKFLDNCSPVELREIDHLIQSPRYQVRMDQTEKDPQPADQQPADYQKIIDATHPTCLDCH